MLSALETIVRYELWIGDHPVSHSIVDRACVVVKYAV